MKKQAKREHTLSSLSSMPGEVPFCKKQAKREHALSSMPGEMPFCKNKLKENMLRQAGQIECQFAKANMFVK